MAQDNRLQIALRLITLLKNPSSTESLLRNESLSAFDPGDVKDVLRGLRAAGVLEEHGGYGRRSIVSNSPTNQKLFVSTMRKALNYTSRPGTEVPLLERAYETLSRSE